MTAKGRILAIRLSDKIKDDPQYAEKIGINCNFKNNKKLKGEFTMETLKKIGLIFIILICMIFLISPVDLFPGLAIDDIFYVIASVASFFKAKHINADKVGMIR